MHPSWPGARVVPDSGVSIILTSKLKSIRAADLPEVCHDQADRRLPGLRRGQPHVREHRCLHQVPAQGIRGADQVRPGERPHQDRRAQRHLGLHPQSHLRGGRPSRRLRGVVQAREPRGQDAPRDHRQADPIARGLLLARATAQADGRARPGPCPHVADVGQPARGAPGRRPRGHPRRRPCPEPVDARALDLRLRGPHLPVAGDHAADRQRGHQGARVGRRARRQNHPDPACAGSRLRRADARSPCPSSTRSGRRWSRPTSRSACTPRTTG